MPDFAETVQRVDRGRTGGGQGKGENGDGEEKEIEGKDGDLVCWGW